MTSGRIDSDRSRPHRSPRSTATSRIRDSQVGRVYDAEHLVHRIFDRAGEYPMVEIAGSQLVLPVERRFASLDDVQKYVDAVLRLNWVRSRWPRSSEAITVRERAGQAAAHYEVLNAVIAVPQRKYGQSWAMRELVILHEIAHHLAAPGETPSHGPLFAARLLELIAEIIGQEAAFLMRVTFFDCDVKLG